METFMEDFIFFIAFLIPAGIAIVICVLRFYNGTIVPLKRNFAKAKTASLISYNESNLTATLINRSPKIANVIKIKKDHNYTIGYKPETLHIGAASVGGVTTGGSYTTGGYNYVSGVSKSGYYNLEYDGHMITKIKLTSEQFDMAKKSVIVAPYLNEKERQIDVHAPVQPPSEMEVKMMLNSLERTGYVGNAGNAKEGYPSKRKCEQILAWLCGI